VGVLVLVVLMVFGSYVSARNQMVAKDQVVKTAWSEVDVQLERRADLIPNLVETVKGFTKEESTVFGDIANARAGMLNAQGPAAKIAANGQLDGASAGCCCSPRTIRNCAPATSSCACRTSWPGPRTASAWRASATTTRCRTTTLHPAVPQQHLGGHGRLPGERRLLQASARANGAQRSSSKASRCRLKKRTGADARKKAIRASGMAFSIVWVQGIAPDRST
jgi:hypothetical protein